MTTVVPELHTARYQTKIRSLRAALLAIAFSVAAYLSPAGGLRRMFILGVVGNAFWAALFIWALLWSAHLTRRRRRRRLADQQRHLQLPGVGPMR